MTPTRSILLLLLVLLSRLPAVAVAAGRKGKKRVAVKLPDPTVNGTAGMTLTEALASRRSVRSYRQGRRLTRKQISQLLWAAQGLTRGTKSRRRTAPSAGGKYPLELYIATRAGHYRYVPRGHRLVRLGSADRRPALYNVSLRQRAVKAAPAVFVVAAVYGRTMSKYGERRSVERYVPMEAGHAAQNLVLQATALGLGGVTIGAFRDMRVQEVLGMPADHEPLYVIPVGHPGRGN